MVRGREYRAMVCVCPNVSLQTSLKGSWQTQVNESGLKAALFSPVLGQARPTVGMGRIQGSYISF